MLAERGFGDRMPLGRIERTPAARPAAYRPEIDGLRAIAVLAVVLFHARIRSFSGGFVGVDVFLVISGYLIAQLIQRESEAGTFTLTGFYERRVRRIMPALLAMLGVSGIAAWMLLPGDFRDFGQSLTAISLFASNLLFWHQDGYFKLATEATPLLHTWSLAVEEQFYILFPALLLLARRRRWNVSMVLAGLGLASFAYGVWATQGRPEAAFYSPLSRAWEFIVGALLALPLLPAPRNRDLGDGLAALGLVAIGGAILFLSRASPFPGLNALAPVLGSALILYGTRAPRSRVAGLLRIRPLVAIGLISYSLYLWHWPMIIFGGYYAIDPSSHVKPVMALLAFPVAWLSWRFVELPFRKPRSLLSRRTLFVTTAAASGALALYGGAIVLADGLPNRFDPVVQRLSERGPAPDYGCADRPLALGDTPRCRIGGTGTRPSFILWGDSHAAVLLPALDALARRHAVSGYSAIALGCPPFVPISAREERPDQWMFGKYNRRKCAARNEQVIRFLSTVRPAAVLLAARWSVYSRGTDGIDDINRQMFEAGVQRVRALGIRIYVVQDVPTSPGADPRSLAKAQLLGATHALEAEVRPYLQRDAAFRSITASLQARGMITVIEPMDRLCDTQRCKLVDKGYPLYFDSNHLSAKGAAVVAPLFEQAMRDLAARPARDQTLGK
ncbi:MAG: O-antigen acetylase [Sphingomonas bacterium]|nr:O-antigen acetylase [Sphingomonas bacterium]